MRVLRVMVGVLLLAVAVSALLVGAGAWYASDSGEDLALPLQAIITALDLLSLGSATWGLLIAGPLLLLLGFLVLAGPHRSRPVLYVLETVPAPPIPVQPDVTGPQATPLRKPAADHRRPADRHGPVVEKPPEWPLWEGERRTEWAVSLATMELPVVVVPSPLEVPTSEMPVVGSPVIVLPVIGSAGTGRDLP